MCKRLECNMTPLRNTISKFVKPHSMPCALKDIVNAQQGLILERIYEIMESGQQPGRMVLFLLTWHRRSRPPKDFCSTERPRIAFAIR